MKTTTPSIELSFSKKYTFAHAQNYFEKHQDGIARKLSDYREKQMARHALAQAGEPTLILDLPCGAGRFWPVLAEHPNRVIIGADNSADMLQVALSQQSPEITARIKAFQTSAFSIDLPDQSVDCIFCMRLLHHIGTAAHRQVILKEFHRVTRDTVILSLWVDGNYKAWKRARLESKRQTEQSDPGNRFVIPRHQIENEFRDAGFQILGHTNLLPFYTMWRVYTLRKII